MKNIVKISTLAAVLMTSGLAMTTATPAMAGETTTRGQAQLQIKKPGRIGTPGKIAPSRGAQQAGDNGNGSGYPNGNKAEAWTAACYAEFGPQANYPNAAMLQKCLNWGSE